MKKMKRNISLILVLSILLSALPIFAMEDNIVMEEEVLPEVSSWAESEIIDAVRYGFYDKYNFFDKNNFKEKIDVETATILELGLVEKLELSGLEKNKDFENILTGNLEKRGGALRKIYNILAPYEDPAALKKDPIMYLNHIGIVKGNGRDLYLDKDITIEETIVFMKRAIDYLYNKENLSAKGMMWEAENKGNKVYMLGSIHLGDSNMYPFSEKIMKKYEESDALYVEVDISDKDSQGELLKLLEEENKKIYYQDGRKLKDVIGEELYNTIKTIMDKYEMEESMYETMKPYGVISQIESFTLLKTMEESKVEEKEISQEDMEELMEMLELFSEGTDYGVDLYFLLKAKADNKEVFELESMEMQYKLLLKGIFQNPYEKLSEEEQIKKLNEVLENYKNPKETKIEIEEIKVEEENPVESIKEMLKSWKDGDAEKLSDILEAQGGQESLGGNLLGDRDKAMAKKIAELLEADEGKTYFIVVGAAHYVTDGMVIDNLKSMGYDINRVR